MKSAHRKTLQAIFSSPVPTTLEWRHIEALFIAIGCRIKEGRGNSRIRVAYGKTSTTFNRPHPRKEAKPYQVRDARQFLEQIGVTP